MKRARWLVAVLVASAAACSVYGEDDDAAPAAPPVVEPTPDGGTTDGTTPALENAADAGPAGGDDAAPTSDADPPGEDASKPDAPAPSGDLYAFVTSAVFTGRLPAAGADAACQDLAKFSPKLKGRKFAAWLGLQGSTVQARIADKAAGRRYVRLDEGVITSAPETMRTSGLVLAIQLTEMGVALPTGATVWTGLSATGENGTNCANWNSQDTALSGTFVPIRSNGWPGSNDLATCDTQHHLYCFEIP